MEGKVTTYLFYTGLVFSFLAIIMCLGVFYYSMESKAYAELEAYCEAVTDISELPEILPSNTYGVVIDKNGNIIFGTKSEYINSETLITEKNIKNFAKNGYTKGIIKTASVETDISYFGIPFKDSGLFVYSETETFASSLGRFFPVLAVIFFAFLVLSAASSILLTDRFMKPVKEITKEDFNFKIAEEKGEIYDELIPILNVKSRAEKMKRQFTANVSHELKTPLTSILGYAQLIESQIATGEDVIKFASVINKESQRMLYLVGDILKLSELEEEHSNITKEKVDLFELSKNAIDALEVVAKKNDIKMSLTGSSTVINANKNLIYELIYNLCDNAIRYNKQGGNVNVVTKNNSVTVLDTGIGIDKKYHSRIFERFYRVDKSRSKQTGGTGLGLSIVKHIAELHNGKISITSEPDQGTQIKVSFHQ